MLVVVFSSSSNPNSTLHQQQQQQQPLYSVWSLCWGGGWLLLVECDIDVVGGVWVDTLLHRSPTEGRGAVEVGIE